MVTLTSMMDINMNSIKKIHTIIFSVNLKMKMAISVLEITIAVMTEMDEADNIEMAYKFRYETAMYKGE